MFFKFAGSTSSALSQLLQKMSGQSHWLNSACYYPKVPLNQISPDSGDQWCDHRCDHRCDHWLLTENYIFIVQVKRSVGIVEYNSTEVVESPSSSTTRVVCQSLGIGVELHHSISDIKFRVTCVWYTFSPLYVNAVARVSALVSFGHVVCSIGSQALRSSNTNAVCFHRPDGETNGYFDVT